LTAFSSVIYSKITSAKATELMPFAEEEREHLTKYTHSLRKIANEKTAGKRIE
jgi:hypothetical protein